MDDVAAAILDRAGPMSTWKLQKLVYYAQAWHLVWEERPLFEDAIEAWANGPVVRSLYNKHRGMFSIPRWADGDPTRLDEGELSTIDAVLATYGPMTGADLSALTHREPPWSKAREGMPDGVRGDRAIPLDVMAEYYGGLV